MLEIKHVSKAYGEYYANKDVNINIGDGEVALLVGPNGAGKSTLIKCIMGLLRYEGEILINGVLNKSEAGRRQIAYVPEVPHLYDLLTVDEHMEFIARAYKLTNWEDYAEDLLQRFELTEHRRKMGSELSKGMQQKVSICTAVLSRPKFILLDEPMVGLDPHAIMELKNLIVELRDQGTSLLISTHILDTVDEIWDMVTIMIKGNVVAIADRSQLEEHGESLEHLFFRVTEPDAVGNILRDSTDYDFEAGAFTEK